MKIVYIFFVLYSVTVFASEEIDCTKAASTLETNKCAAIDRAKAENEMKTFVAAVEQKLMDNLKKEDAKEFLKLQKQWKTFSYQQCMHSRKIYGRGTFGSLSFITCQESMYRNRTRELKLLYKDLWGR